jgi:hypothetical protein
MKTQLGIIVRTGSTESRTKTPH